MLTLTKTSLSGSVMGRPVNALALPGSSDAAPPPGEYDLLPALQDPFFGTYIIATRRGSGFKPGYEGIKRPGGPGVAVGHEGIKLPSTPFAPSWKKWRGAVGDPTEAVFVLCEKPIPGRNCVVLVAGLSDLLEALKGAPGAPLRVI